MIRRITVFILAAMIAAPLAPANAQFGSLIKKAKQAVTKDTATTAVSNTSSAALVTGTLVTSTQLDALLRGLAARIPIIAQRDEQMRIRKELEDKKLKLQDANGAAIGAYQNQDRLVQDCQGPVIKAEEEKHKGELAGKMMQMMSNPAQAAKFQQDQLAAMQKSQELAAKGDTAGSNAAQASFWKSIGIDLRPDTIVAEKRCGKRPQPPAAVAKIDDIYKQIKTTWDKQREIEPRIGPAGAAAAGMTLEQWALTYERLVDWYISCGKKPNCSRVTPAENALFQQRRAEIEKLGDGFRGHEET
jgi:hypothetical protein